MFVGYLITNGSQFLKCQAWLQTTQKIPTNLIVVVEKPLTKTDILTLRLTTVLIGRENITSVPVKGKYGPEQIYHSKLRMF